MSPITLDFLLQALEYRDYSPQGLKSRGMPGRLAGDLVLLCLIVMYCALTARDIVLSIKVCLQFSCLDSA